MTGANEGLPSANPDEGEPTLERLSVSITGDAADYVRDYMSRHPETRSTAQLIRNGLALVRLVDSLPPGHRLAIEDHESGDVIPVNIPWSPDPNQFKLDGF